MFLRRNHDQISGLSIGLPAHDQVGTGYQGGAGKAHDGIRSSNPSENIYRYPANERFTPKSSNATETSRALAIMRWRALA